MGAKLTPMEMEKSAWTSSSLKSLRSSKRFHEEISTGQRLLHLLFNSLIDSRFDFFSFFLFANTHFSNFFFYILSFSVILSVYVLYVLFFSHGVNERILFFTPRYFYLKQTWQTK